MNSFYVSPALENPHNFNKVVKEMTGMQPQMYTTDEMMLALNMLGAYYLTGHLTRKEYIESASNFPIKTQPFKKVFKRIKKEDQVEMTGFRFDYKTIDHREISELLQSSVPKLKQLPQVVARINDMYIVFDSVEGANTFVDELDL